MIYSTKKVMKVKSQPTDDSTTVDSVSGDVWSMNHRRFCKYENVILLCVHNLISAFNTYVCIYVCVCDFLLENAKAA